MIVLTTKQRAENEDEKKRRLEKVLERSIVSPFRIALIGFTTQYRETGTIPPLDTFQDDISDRLSTHYRKVQREFRPDVLAGTGLEEPASADGIIVAAFAAWAARRAFRQSIFIARTVGRRIANSVNQAIDLLGSGRRSNEEVSRTARNILGPRLQTQRTTIGITETQAAAEGGKQIVVDAVTGRVPRVLAGESAGGFVPVLQNDALSLVKEWATEGDERVRLRHVVTNGQVRDVTELFNVDGEAMMHPGDTDFGASLNNVVNCRCSAIFRGK